MEIKERKNIKRRLKKLEGILVGRINASKKNNYLRERIEDLQHSISSGSDVINSFEIRRCAFEYQLAGVGNVMFYDSEDLSDAINGWNLMLYSNLYRELSLYKNSQEKDFSPSSNGGGFIGFVWALCALYYFDVKIECHHNPIHMMEIQILRGDIEYNIENSPDFLWLLPLVKLLFSDSENKAESLSELAQFERFQFLTHAWDDDELFSKGLTELGMHHLDECRVAYQYGSFYPVEHYALFPVWILALDKYRERQLGRSALPEHPVFDYSKRIKAATFEIQSNDVLNKLENHYQQHYAEKKLDLYQFWKTYKHKI